MAIWSGISSWRENLSKQKSGSTRNGAKDVDTYLAAVPEPARSTLQKLRHRIKAAAPQAEEVISYQMPTYKHLGRALVGFAAWKNFCSLYPYTGSVWTEFKDELKGYGTSPSKGAIQFPVDKPLPASLVKKIVKARIKEIESR
jgi:uncharacterized protein YdhG (YjbR/CyaY superfamily)